MARFPHDSPFAGRGRVKSPPIWLSSFQQLPLAFQQHHMA